MPHAANWFCSGRAPGLLGSAHPNISPYDKFQAGDGEIFLGVVNDGQFRKLCERIGRAGPRGGPALHDQCEPAREPRGAARRARASLRHVRGRAAVPRPDARGRSGRARATPCRRRSRRRTPRIAACSSRTAAIAVSARRSSCPRTPREVPRAGRRVSASMPTRSSPRPATRAERMRRTAQDHRAWCTTARSAT